MNPGVLATGARRRLREGCAKGARRYEMVHVVADEMRWRRDSGGTSRSTGTMAAAAPWIPLRDDYFETPLLSHKETAYLVRKSCEAAQEVVERARSSGGPIQWRHVEKYGELQLYAGFSRGTYSAEPTSMCGVTSVPGSLAEIAALFDLSTTRAMKDFSRAHRELFFDGVVLHTLSPRTRDRPLHQVTAKWIATRCPKGLDDRDYCYLECQDKFTDSAGRKGWVLCIHSIKLPGCEDLSREFGFVRGSFYHSGIVVVEAERPGFVDVIHMLQINLKNNTKMPQSYLRERVAWIAKLKNVLREKRLNEQRYLSDLELVPKKYRSRCNVCQDSFSLLLLRKMNCRKCGEVVCGACSKDFDVTNAKFLETVKLRICMHCYQLITSGQMLGTILDQPRASTAVSLLGYYDDTQRASVITDALPPNAQVNGRGGRERPPKIILHSMARERADRRSRRTTAARDTIAAHRMQPMPINTDHGARNRRGRPTAVGPPASVPNGISYDYERGYDARSLFDKQRSSISSEGSYIPVPVPVPVPVPAPTPPASLFDRRSTRSKLDDFDARRSEDFKSIKQPSLMTPSPRSKRNSTRESRGRFKIPHSLYDYSALDPDAANVPPPSSPIERNRAESNSSVSSTGSIDIDSYQVKKTNGVNGDGHMVSTSEHGDVYQNALLRDRHGQDDEDTEGSVGSGDDEPDYVPRERASPPRAVPTYYEDEEEETKSSEFEATPALPPPSPSDYQAMEEALLASGRQSLDLPFKRRNFNVSDLSVNTADCDTSYLDSEMRQFHGQPFFMRGIHESDPRETIDFTNGPSPNTSLDGFPNDANINASPKARESSVIGTQSPASKTSPQKPASMVVRPPLYGRPKREVNRTDSSASSEDSASSGDAAVINQSLALANGPTPRSFDLSNGSLLSTVPSTHSNEDLTFAPDGGSITTKVLGTSGESTAQAVAPNADSEPAHTTIRPPAPPAPSYVPSRFQNRQQPAREPASQEESVYGKRVSEELLRKDDETIERILKRDSSRSNERSSGASANQDHIDDVDFEELLRMSISNQNDNDAKNQVTGPSSLVRSETFDISRASVETDLGEFHDSSESESDDGDLLSARRIYSKFNSSKRLANVAGVRQNPMFQRKFEEIQERIHMLSDSEDESEDEGWSEQPIGAHTTL